MIVAVVVVVVFYVAVVAVVVVVADVVVVMIVVVVVVVVKAAAFSEQLVRCKASKDGKDIKEQFTTGPLDRPEGSKVRKKIGAGMNHQIAKVVI